MTILELANEFALVLLAAVAEELESVVLGYVGTYNLLLLTGEFKHLLLNLGEVGSGDGVLSGVDIIVETVFDSRTDTEFHTGIQFLECFGEKVCRAVPEGVLAFSIVPFEQFDISVFGYGACEVPFLIIDRCRQHVLSQTRADAFGYLQRSNATFKFFYRIVGKCYLYH